MFFDERRMNHAKFLMNLILRLALVLGTKGWAADEDFNLNAGLSDSHYSQSSQDEEGSPHSPKGKTSCQQITFEETKEEANDAKSTFEGLNPEAPPQQEGDPNILELFIEPPAQEQLSTLYRKKVLLSKPQPLLSPSEEKKIVIPKDLPLTEAQKEAAEDQRKRALVADAAKDYIESNPILLQLNQDELFYYFVKKWQETYEQSWENSCTGYGAYLTALRHEFSGQASQYDVSEKTMMAVLEETIGQYQKEHWPYQSFPSGMRGNNCLFYSILGQNEEITQSLFGFYKQNKTWFEDLEQKSIETLINLFYRKSEASKDVWDEEKWNAGGFLIDEQNYDFNPVRLIVKKSIEKWLEEELKKTENDLLIVSNQTTMIEYLWGSGVLTGKKKENTKEALCEFDRAIKIECADFGYTEGFYDILYDIKVNHNLLMRQELPPEIATWLGLMTKTPIYVLKKYEDSKSNGNIVPLEISQLDKKPIFVQQAYGDGDSGHYEKLRCIGY